jgi:hypothetical protein
MQKKLNEEFIEEYSERFASQVSDRFFAGKSHITGAEILTVTPSKQINFFVIKLLFNNWQQESQRLESPFFDYHAPEVREALLQFMNVLSRHIKVRRAEFEHILQDAVRDTLFLLLAPDAFLEIELDRKGTVVFSEKTVKNLLKYVKVSKQGLTTLLMDNIGKELDEIEIPRNLTSSEALEEEIGNLNAVLPLSLADLFEESNARNTPLPEADTLDEVLTFDMDEEDLFAPKKEQVKAEEEVEEQGPEHIEVSFKEPETEAEVEEPESQPAPGPELVVDEEEQWVPDDEPEETVQPEAEIQVNEEEPEQQEESEYEVTVEEETEVLVVESTDDKGVDEEEGVGLEWSALPPANDFDEDDLDNDPEEESPIPLAGEVITNMEDDEDEEDDMGTLNSRFGDPAAPPTIASVHEERKVDSMLEAISLNHRYMFINELFGGDSKTFTEAIEAVDASSSFDESVELLVHRYARNNAWDMNSEEVKELLKIIFRRFR